MADENVSLLQGISFMEKCLDAALNEQRSIAHSAIDMDDWGKAQEILAAAKKNISAVEEFKKGFADYKKSVLAVDMTSELGALGVELPINSSATGDGSSPKEPADEPPPAAVTKSEPAPAPEPAPEPASASEPVPAGEEQQGGFSLVDACEELIAEYPFAMAVCYSAPSVIGCFTPDEVIASDMNNPEQLSNGVWVETDLPEDRAREIVNELREYCEQQKQGNV